MKPLKLLIAVLVIPIIFCSCKKESLDIDNENIILRLDPPGVAIYKSNGDYFKYVYVGIDSSKNITNTPAYNSNSPFIVTDNSGNVTYTQRWKLKHGFIASKEMTYSIAFTNVTFQEQVEYVDKNGGDIPVSWFNSRIIDKNPFTDYYYSKAGYPAKEITLGELNKMIENGSLETVFTKIK